MKKLLSVLLASAVLTTTVVPALAASDEAVKAANELYSQGLFNGTGKDTNGNPNFELDRAPTRAEAVTMLVRLLGKDSEARNGSWDTPFTDVEDWAKPYVGYAYTNKLTTGTSATTFGDTETITASQYLTFVLRALGYESGKDFQWDKAWELSDKLGITNGEYAKTSSFTRGDVAIISRNALSARKDNGEATDSIDISGYWLGANSSNEEEGYTMEAFYFNGSQYSCAYQGFSKDDKLIYSAYEEGSFTYVDDQLSLTTSKTYIYKEYSSTLETSTEKSTNTFKVGIHDGYITMNQWAYRRMDDTASIYSNVKEYVMGQTSSTSSSQYVSLAQSDYRRIHRNNPQSVPTEAYVYAYKDLNNDLCVITVVRYAVNGTSNTVVTLHNMTKNYLLEDPVAYYKDKINRTFGSERDYFLDMGIETTTNITSMLQALIDIRNIGKNTFDGVFINASTLNK